MSEDDLLTLKEVSSQLRVPEGTLRYWRHLGTYGPQSVRIGRRVLYRRTDVKRWLEAQYRSQTIGGDAA